MSGGSRAFGGSRGGSEVWAASLLRSNIQEGGSSRPNGSGYPLSVPAVAHPSPPQFEGMRRGKGEDKPPKCPTRHPGLADCYIILCYIILCCAILNYIILYYLLKYIILYYIILYSIISYYII